MGVFLLCFFDENHNNKKKGIFPISSSKFLLFFYSSSSSSSSRGMYEASPCAATSLSARMYLWMGEQPRRDKPASQITLPNGSPTSSQQLVQRRPLIELLMVQEAGQEQLPRAVLTSMIRGDGGGGERRRRRMEDVMSGGRSLGQRRKKQDGRQKTEGKERGKESPEQCEAKTIIMKKKHR